MNINNKFYQILSTLASISIVFVVTSFSITYSQYPKKAYDVPGCYIHSSSVLTHRGMGEGVWLG